MSLCDQITHVLNEKAEIRRKRRAGPSFDTKAELQQMAVLAYYLNLLPSDRAQKKARYVSRVWQQQQQRSVA